MKKTLLFFIPYCVAILYGCKQKPTIVSVPADYGLKKIVLQDSLAIVEIYVPIELDTFFEWIHISDNTCDDLKKYRFASRTLPVVAENGFFYDLPDSAYQLTINHVDRYRCKYGQLKNLDSVYLSGRIARIKREYAEIGDSSESIDGKVDVYNNARFIVMAYSCIEGYPKKQRMKYVYAATAIDSNILEFTYYTNVGGHSDFIERMMASLATVKITSSSTATSKGK